MVKKKKVNHFQNDLLLKKQHKNKFLAKLRRLYDAVSNPKIYPLIPQKDIDFIYEVRGRSVRVQAANGAEVPDQMLKESKFIISAMFKDQQIPVVENGLTISLDDFYTLGYSLLIYIERLKDDWYPAAKEVKTALSPFVRHANKNKDSLDHFNDIKDTISIMNSSLDSRMYLFKSEIFKGVDGKTGFAFAMEIYCQKCEKIQIVLENEPRPVYRVGWQIEQPDAKMDWVNIKAEDLNLDQSFDGQSFDVYIQSHAMERLNERIDCVPIGFLHVSVYSALKKIKFIKNEMGNILFDYCLGGVKVGYLLGKLVEGKIIITTFLFLTNDGTPEGKKLRENTGLLKEDKKHLTIDKLNTFILTDIEKDARLKKIFIDAGCGTLFQLDNRVFVNPEDRGKKPIAKQIADYIGLKIDDIE